MTRSLRSKLICIFILIALIKTTDETCGKLEKCDKIVSVSLFQKGVCGRTARCFWELMHLEKYLLQNTANVADYENKIKKALCHIPNFAVYLALYKQKATFIPCENDETLAYNVSALNDTYGHFPMPGLYKIEDEEGTTSYLNRMVNCRDLEIECLEKLNKTVVEMCTNDITLAHINDIEKNHMKTRMRGKMTYQFVYGKNNSFQEGLAGGNKCTMRRLGRVRHPATDQHEDISYDDKYVISKAPQRVLYHKQAYQIRPPYYDLYVLYMSDPHGHFAQAPANERWWNESKAYQELAHYLPTNVVEHYHKAVKCVYDNVHSKFMEWKPEKYCYGSSTFICVQDDLMKNPNCSAIGVEQYDSEHTGSSSASTTSPTTTTTTTATTNTTSTTPSAVGR